MTDINCYALDYRPRFDNLLFNKSYYIKLLNFINYDNGIPMPLILIGKDGTNKLTLTKCVIHKLYGFDMILNAFHPYETDALIYYYESIYYIDCNTMTSAKYYEKCEDNLQYIFSRPAVIGPKKCLILNNIHKLEKRIITNISNLYSSYHNNFILICISKKNLFATNLFKMSFCFFCNPFKLHDFIDFITQFLKYYKIKLTDNVPDIKNKEILLKNFKKEHKITAKIDFAIMLLYFSYLDNMKNIRTTLLMLQDAKVNNLSISKSFDNNYYINIINTCLKEYSKENITYILDNVYKLIQFGYDSNYILKKTLYYISKNKNISSAKRIKIVEIMATTSHEFTKTRNDIIAFEKFYIYLIGILNE